MSDTETFKLKAIERIQNIIDKTTIKECPICKLAILYNYSCPRTDDEGIKCPVFDSCNSFSMIVRNFKIQLSTLQTEIIKNRIT